MTRALAAALALAATSAAVPAARADDIAVAKEHFRKGVELYRAKRWREAIAEFEAAYRAKPHGAIHFNVAQCRERLEEWPLALRSWLDYLHEVPDASDRAAVRASIGRIEARLQASGVQELVVYSDPPGAEVRLDGRGRGRTPFHTVLPPATYALALALDGYEEVSEDVALAPGAARVVDLVLRPAGANGRATTATSTATATATATATTTATTTATPTATTTSSPTSRAPADLSARPAAPARAVAAAAAGPSPVPTRAKRRVYTWIAAGTAVAAASAGAYLGWSARRDERAIDAMSAPDRALAQRTADDARSKSRAANVLYAAAGTAGAAGVTLFFLERRF